MTSPTTDSTFVTVGVDESPESLEAVAWAAKFAVADGSVLKLVHVIAPIEWMFGATNAFSPDGLKSKLLAEADAVLAGAEKAARAAESGVRVERIVPDGPVAEKLAEVADGGRLLVIASGSSSLLGGHVTKIVNRATTPVLVWRASLAKRTGPPLPVAVGVDESENAERAVRAAFEVAKVLRAPIEAIHMWETSAAVGLGYAAGPTDWDLQRVLKAEQTEQVAALIAPIAKDFPHVHTSTVRADTTPVKGLTEVSEHAQLVAVGSRGRGRLAAAILGSVSGSLLHHARCPVLVVR
ncbi:universal stress protein [Gordonia sp. ABSL1-1]|uniref:universal stress protein n=1 Tax=Gordonia sp. ABSL1-1 TaxID=3053923 RepID=UPI0025733C19|nr:universal stress protein [Gordonia sp. ABSL1-1]MDL9937686.1 universal stress protein [Gordonia sp. ABSL1-1]